MPTFINGLPLHPLVVHAVVVLVPLSVLGTIVAVLWPAARRRYGSLVLLTVLLAAVTSVVAESTGEGLQRNLPTDPSIQAHAELGDSLKLLAGALFLVFAAFLLVHRGVTARREGPGTTTAPALTGARRTATVVFAALTIVVALVTAVQVYRIGDSGAQAVWGGRVYTPQQGPPGPPPGR